MKKEDLFDAVGNVDTDLLIRSERMAEKRRKWWNSPWAAAGVPVTIAAVLVCALTASLTGLEKNPQESPAQSLESEIEIPALAMREEIIKDIENKKQDIRYPGTEEFDEVKAALGTEYGDLTVQEAAQKLVPWVEENLDIAGSVVKNAMYEEVVLDSSTSMQDGYYWEWMGEQNAMTISSVVQDAVNLVTETQEDPVYQTSKFSQKKAMEETESEYDCKIRWEWDFCYSYHVKNPAIMTVSERNEYLEAMNSAIEAYLINRNDAAWAFMTQEQMEKDLAEIAKEYSNDDITFVVDREMVYFGKSVAGGNELELAPSFETLTVQKESGEKITISSATLKLKVYLSLKQSGLVFRTKTVEAMGLEAYQLTQAEERWQLLTEFWLDDIPCELYRSHLKIGDDWYSIIGGGEGIQDVIEQAVKTAERALK